MGGMCRLMEHEEFTSNLKSEKLKERDTLRDKGVNGKVILKWILKGWGVSVRISFTGSRKVLQTGCYERSNEMAGSIKACIFLPPEQASGIP
jgi:hypothetical protein